ncbi:hypothetical protein K439DRAFT_906236 [Ramaria rubella]|nr:hypothetical protein K439DRAFT_906236 [Ramaria rubella]
MFTYLLLLALPVTIISGRISQTHGVAPELQMRYTPSSSSHPTWQCLDDSHIISWTAVNDDYCDCPDGSDEPGTSACPDTTFYCINEGHIGGRIASSRVNDGVCEQECCDGSDEPSGICANMCSEMGEEYRQKVNAERKLRKTGSKIRTTYITFAHKEKKRLEDSVVLLEREVDVREKEVARLKDIMERAEMVSEAALNFKKESRELVGAGFSSFSSACRSALYQSLLTHHSALKSLRRAYTSHVQREKQLGDILEALKGGYNPNYQDMAVLEAVRGWEALQKVEQEGEEGEEGEWTEAHLEHQLEGVINQDHVALLLGHESHLHQETTSLLFDLSAYIPEALAPQYTWFRETITEWLRTFGMVRDVVTNPDATSQARAAYHDAENKLNSVKNQRRDDQDELAELFDPEGFGIEGEWKKLQGLCLSKDTGEYTYEVCLFGDATQKGGGHHNLGKFASWSTDPNIKPGEPRYYEIQHYTRGAKCWNGPERSVTLHLSCGIENQILTVAEPEKCEYHLTATTPALCLPLDVIENSRQEL